MLLLVSLGIAVSVLCAVGVFLDKYHLEASTIEKIRIKLIQFYIFLYDARSKLTKRSGPIISWFDKLHEKRPFNIRTGEYIVEKQNWTALICQLAFAIIFPVVQMEFFFNEEAEHLDRATGWFLAIVGGAILAYMSPLLLLLAAGIWALGIMLVCVLILAILEAIRNLVLVVLNKSTSPKTSPFTYFAALISVVGTVATGASGIAHLWGLI